MDTSQQSYDRLVHLIYETINDINQWDEVFSALRQALDCKVVHAFAIDKQHGTMSFSTGANLPADGELSYLQKYQFIDPRSEHWNVLPSLGCFHDHEVFDDAYVENSDFYQSFLLPYGVRYLSAFKVVENETISFSIGCLRGPEQGPLPPDAIKLTQQLLPHLHRAVKINTSHFIYSTQALIGHSLVNRMKQPVLLSSTSGKVVLANLAAQSLLNHTQAISLKEGQLCLPEPSMTQLLEEFACIERGIKNGAYAPGREYGYKVLAITPNSSNNPSKILLFYLPLIPQFTLGVFGMRPLMMLILYHADHTVSMSDNMLLSAAFGLSPAELKIAAMIADGQTLNEIALHLNKQPDTVRKQLQSIYQKTSTNNQVEFMRLLQHMPDNRLFTQNAHHHPQPLQEKA